MKLNFSHKQKNKQVAVRLTQEEYNFVEKLAKENEVSMMEACRVLIEAAISELKMK